MKIDHADIQADLEAADSKSVTYTLTADDYMTEFFTSTKGWFIEGPAVVIITRHRDGGVDVVVRR